MKEIPKVKKVEIMDLGPEVLPLLNMKKQTNLKTVNLEC